MSKLFVLAVASVFLSVAHATSMVVMDVQQQAEESHALVLAIVGRSTVVETERWVYTDTVLQIADVLGGEVPRSIVLRQIGGRIGERVVHVAGDAPLVEGERVAAFVPQRDGRWYLTCMGQSVWTVDAEEGLVQAIDVDHLLERDRHGRIVPASQSPVGFDHLVDLAAEVAAVRFGGAL